MNVLTNSLKYIPHYSDRFPNASFRRIGHYCEIILMEGLEFKDWAAFIITSLSVANLVLPTSLEADRKNNQNILFDIKYNEIDGSRYYRTKIAIKGWQTDTIIMEDIMSKKYKELPAFETNEFKVGDLVKVYVGTDIFQTRVLEIRRDHFVIIEDSEDRGYDIAHFKQCRKLEEIKPREFNVIVTEDGEIITAPSHALPNFTFNNKPVTYIKVREVLDDN